MTVEIKVQKAHERKQMTYMQRWCGRVNTGVYGYFVRAEKEIKTPGKAIGKYAG